MNPATVLRLLDPSEAGALLGALCPSIDPGNVALESVWAKPGRHFTACYRIDGEPRGRLASLCIVDETRAARAERRIARMDATVVEPAAAMVADDILAQLFPFDYRLDHLPECMKPRIVRSVLRDAAVDEVEVAAYRAGMRCQLRYLSGGRARAYGKVAVESDPGRRRRVHRQLCEATTATSLKVPPLLGSVEEIGLDLVEAVGGSSLHDLLAAAPDREGVAATAEALAELHAALGPLADRVHTADDELALLRSWESWMTGIEPLVAERAGRVLARLASGAPAGRPASFAHRDFHDKQVLLDGPRRWLLDVDTACTGDRELDLGNFVAHLYLRGLQWDRESDHRELEALAVQAYGHRAGREATRWYRSASLVRLAFVYWLRPRWRHVTDALLGEAERS